MRHYPRKACITSPRGDITSRRDITSLKSDITRDSDTYSQCLLASR